MLGHHPNSYRTSSSWLLMKAEGIFIVLADLSTDMKEGLIITSPFSGFNLCNYIVCQVFSITKHPPTANEENVELRFGWTNENTKNAASIKFFYNILAQMARFPNKDQNQKSYTFECHNG